MTLRKFGLVARVKITICGLTLTVMVDSGATYVLMDLTWAKQNVPNFNERFVSDPQPALTLGDGAPAESLTPLGHVDVTFTFGTRNVIQQCCF